MTTTVAILIYATVLYKTHKEQKVFLPTYNVFKRDIYL